jgi:NTP pyrophosphatase (non-canonical NTP hydrolase)|tara:strand:- start:1046 stop:1309 length:264 start_codon:yes stop_codon:yes gene_type:complete
MKKAEIEKITQYGAEHTAQRHKLIKQVIAQFARDMGEPYHNEEAIEDVLWDCLNAAETLHEEYILCEIEDIFETYLRNQSEEYTEDT